MATGTGSPGRSGVGGLAVKQRTSHDDWLAAFAAIRADPATPARAAALVESAAARVASRLAAPARGTAHPTSPAPRAAFGWSGGKDSLALEIVARAAGLERCVLVISGLEYPAFLAWATDNMPWGLTVECRSNLNLGWLRAHPGMLFPADADTAARWFAALQHAGQRAYAARTGLDLLLLGRRRADGNHLGPADPDPARAGSYEYVDRGGFARVSPIGDWSHEDVLTVLAAHGVDLPPCYSWPRGFRVGTGPWPARQWTASPEHGWDEVTSIDPTVTESAARAGIPGASEALARCAAS